MKSHRGAAVAHAAQALVGVPFRLRGRDPAWGLDCVGLVAVALRRAGLGVHDPPRYGLRNSDDREADRLAAESELEPCTLPRRPGDIVMVRTGPAQVHLLVSADNGGFVHADAGLRCVVLVPGTPPWPVLRPGRPIEQG